MYERRGLLAPARTAGGTRLSAKPISSCFFGSRNYSTMASTSQEYAEC
nr:hypothetical protein [Nocardioides cynanchi]